MILNRGEHVAIVPDEEIEAIQRALDGDFSVEPFPFLRCGTRVRVTRGALGGRRRYPAFRKKNLFRLILSVDMLAQSVAVEVDASDVKPCSSNHQGREPNSATMCTGQSQIQSGNSLQVAAFQSRYPLLRSYRFGFKRPVVIWASHLLYRASSGNLRWEILRHQQVHPGQCGSGKPSSNVGAIWRSNSAF